ncbi:autotransporter outer membrane beta-barrel domain-containing protein [Burkholderia ambifaria]|uniref:Autotransporter outer membrane beta-barrel domain-containing protein n=1 Tax=Burkholderia ambifaria TaxID=152480 RepID=A0AA41EC13_9BURK|nr:autotransporter outer membrane beta-barrel domain-containing protein [Burkholderia ambifaria]MBR8132167.1 autotransporter outer membrane beta-barrel domain-containing protein [Burkholderia ambifaria]PRE04668.1 autotransporter outer membrane beta-barrel domain-containing protein [Burkholderia ambifaria]
MNHRRFPFSRARTGRRLAHSALIAGAVIPWPPLAQAGGGPQHANGVELEVAPGDYSTTQTGQSVLSAINGGRLTTIGKTRAFSTGHVAAGAAASGAGSRLELRDTEIRTRGRNSVGIDVRNGASASAERSSIDTDGDYAHGAYIYGAGGQLRISDSVIVTRGKESSGIAANGAPGGTIDVADTLIRTSGVLATGLSISYDGVRATLERTDIRTAGDLASGLYLPSTAAVTFRDSHLETAGEAAVGIDTRAGAVALARTRVVTHGTSAHGLYASKEYADTPVVDATDTHVTTTGARSIGAIARLGGKLAMTRGSIETRGERARGAMSSGTGSLAALTDMTVDTHGTDAAALYASAGGRIDLLRTDARTSGDGAYAASVHDGALTVDDGSIVSARHGALDASGATITLRNGTRAIGGNGTLLSVDAESGTPVRLTLDTGSHADGNIVNRPASDRRPTHAVADVALSGASAWTGATDAVRALSLDTDSRWTVTANSSVGSLALNDSTIAFAAPAAGAPATPRTLVVTGDYAARNGKLVLHTTLQDDASPTDRLVIDGGHASGDTGIVVKRTGGDGAPTTIGIPLVETRNGGTTDVAAFALDAASDGYRTGFGTLSAGGYDYMLKRGGTGGHEENWYLVSAAKPEPPPPAPGPADPDPPVSPETVPPVPPRAAAPEPDAYLANADAAATMAIHTLHQREDRSLREASGATPPLDGAVWLRAEGQFTSMSGGHRSVSGNGRLIHAGADLLRFDDGRGGSVRVGAMGMYGSQTSWSTRPLWNAAEQRMADATARGSVAGYNVGLYGTWYGNRDILSGPYVDAWFMYGAYANSVGGSLAGDSYRSRTVTGSVETGYSIRFYERGDTRFFVEPEAQLVVSDYRAAAHDAPGGRLDGQGSTDVLTRLGVRVHGVTAMPSGRELRPFVEANWWHGPGSRSLTLDRNAFSFSVPRDRAAFRVGAKGQLSKRFVISASLGLEANLSDYAVVKGELAAKYRW